ncbi:AfsR/SARP family transcriptional regulator [Herbidospora cretacea]|uniref:AfsR/SARP family transcriptional regulator n=1 Tax=Herbidospora cretacea TaxID=28444 RepID=UPI000A4C3435|nr:BTAD domain-containing putative transcriptional regulator [Herbidospora cretacea]
MRLGVLGPLALTVEGEGVPLRSAKQRMLLATLAAHSGRSVSGRCLMETLWDSPPVSAGDNLRLYLHYLRRALGDRDRIISEPAGHRLVVGPGEVDVEVFEGLVRQADLDLAGGRLAEASEAYGRALALWRGPAYGDLADLPLVRPSVLRLEEARLRATEQRITADLGLGRHADLVTELTALVAGHPLRERLRAHLMLALHRSGRRADALGVYREGRRSLVRELGLEPGPELRALHESILREDAADDRLRAGAPVRMCHPVRDAGATTVREVRFGLLGPVEVWCGGQAVPVGGPRERKGLAALLARPGSLVTVAQLTRALWAGDPPATAQAQVRTVMSRLRRNLEPVTGATLIARGEAGFTLDTAGVELDLWEFRRWSEQGFSLAGQGRTSEAVDLLRQALALWRGPAFGGLRSPLLTAAAQRLDEERLRCRERSLELELRLGRYSEVSAELGELVGEHPLRERLVELWMKALCLAGRRHDALDAYAAVRALLVERTGLDPSPALRNLHSAILREDPGLTARPGKTPAARPWQPKVSCSGSPRHRCSGCSHRQRNIFRRG